VLEPLGLVKLSPNFPWRDVPVKPALAHELETVGVRGLPIHVRNDYDVAVLGEYEFGADPMPDPMIYLGMGVGVGAGIIVRDRLFVGAEGFAGEVGHSILQLDGPVCSCGRHGCAEAFIGLRAISAQITGNAAEILTVATIREMLDSGDAAAILAVRRAGHYLGVLIQNLWTYFNPGRLVLGGPSCDLGEPLLGAAHSCLDRYSRDCGLTLPEICLSKFGALSVAVGAAALVKHVLLRPMDLDYAHF
jgi:predicted NBD/HSP70 family sugar kinase